MDRYRPTIVDYFRLWIRYYVGRIYKPLSITRRSFYLIFDQTCGFYLRFMNTIWKQKTDRRLLLWIRCNAGRTQTALNYKTRLLFDLRLSDLWSIEICRRRCVRKVKAPFFTGKPVISGFSHLLLIHTYLFICF